VRFNVGHDRRPAEAGNNLAQEFEALVSKIDSPLALPPGHARLATMPARTGSPAAAKTIGMVEVACLAARIDGVT